MDHEIAADNLECFSYEFKAIQKLQKQTITVIVLLTLVFEEHGTFAE